MHKILLLVTLCTAGLFSQEVPVNFSLYSDQKAKVMEDIITVLIIEEASANNDTRTETDVDHRAHFNVSAGTGKLKNLVPNMGFGMDNQSDYDGRGRTSREGTVKAKVAARIVAVYDNGNLLIEGNKEVLVNNETEIIRVSGIIRPEDIQFDNTIFSYQIADAKIKYTGKGVLQDTQKPGIFVRFFNWLF
ncbi:MAG: flagellar basal body L-ring protein FlgH [Fibrobacteria bacterium]|nr:flagellar basal body L-ring protein FlgH [Fibrobacteria bacterium]